MSAYPKLKLTYFDMQGRAEAIRVTLHIGGVPFIDERLSKAEFEARKHSFPYGKVPILEINDSEIIAETQGILRYAARLAGLYPVNDAVAAALVDEILSAWEEFFDRMFSSSWKQSDAEMVKRERERVLAGPWHAALECIKARLKRISEYPLFKHSDKPSLHEIITWDSLDLLKSGSMEHIPSNTTERYATMEAIYNKVQALPQVQYWLAHQSNTTPKKLKLTYFDMQNRAEQTRLALFIAGIPFEDERLTREEFEQQRHNFPYAQLPVLEIDGRVVAQSFGLLRYAGTITGMYPVNDLLLAAKIDEVIGHVDELLVSTGPSFIETDPVKQREMRDQLARVSIPASLASLEKRLIQWKPTTVEKGAAVYAMGGDLMTIADLAIYTLVHFLKCGLLEHVPTSIADQYVSLIAVHDAVLKHPRVVEWYKTHSQACP